MSGIMWTPATVAGVGQLDWRGGTVAAGSARRDRHDATTRVAPADADRSDDELVRLPWLPLRIAAFVFEEGFERSIFRE